MGKLSKALNKSRSSDAPGTEAPESSSIAEDQAEAAELPKRSAPRQRSYKTAGFEKRSPRLTMPADADTAAWDERLVDSTRNLTGVAEGIRKLRTMITHRQGRDAVRSIMILSSDPREGKSFVCANLGISLARSVEHRALLIDCDLRRPSLHNLFGLSNTNGLSEYLQNGADISEMIQGTGLPKLSMISSGPPPPNPSELLSSEKMAEGLEELTATARDRLVVLDTPPFRAASEAIILSQLVDKIILVVRWGKTGRENVKKMVDTIGREKILGTVFNAFEMNFLDRRVQGVGYHNYYSEHY